MMDAMVHQMRLSRPCTGASAKNRYPIMQSHSLSGGNIVKGKMLVLALAGALLFGITAYAHHSFAGTYDLSQQIKVEGKLVQFLFRNPHSFVHIEAPDANGQMQRWAVEWGGAGQLGAQGVTAQTFHPGDIVTISGNPGRNPEDHRIRMVSLRRKSDGVGWGQRPGETVN